MRESYLEVTFRHGVPIAAYYYLPRALRTKFHRTVRSQDGLLIDYDRSGAPMGIEITSPKKLTLATLNRVLRDLGMPAVKSTDLAPLRAA